MDLFYRRMTRYTTLSLALPAAVLLQVVSSASTRWGHHIHHILTFVKLKLSPELPVTKGQTLGQVLDRMVVTVPLSPGGMASMCSRA